jgi:hypothetical protein
VKKFTPILKSAALGFFLATLAFMFLVRIVGVDDDLAGVTFFVLWPILSYGLWWISRRQRIVSPEGATASIKPKPRAPGAKRLLVTALLAILLSVILAFTINADVVGIAFIPLWIALYYGWPYLSRRWPFLDFERMPATPAPKRPLWLRLMRGAGALVGGVVLALAGVASIVVVPIALCHHRAQKVHDSIHVGMTVPEVLHVAKDCDIFQASSEFPHDDDADPNNLPAMSLSWRKDGSYHTYDLASGQTLNLSESEAVDRLHARLHDGYPWHFHYTYINSTPQHVSFSVEFGPDGRVAAVKPVYGWD